MKSTFAMKLPILFFALMLATTGCVAPTPSPVPSIPTEQLSTATAIIVVATPTPRIVVVTPTPIDTPVPTATTVAAGWTTQRLEDVGIQLSIPADWTIFNHERVLYYTRPASVESGIDPAAFPFGVGFQLDAPTSMPELIAQQQQRLREGEVDPSALTYEMTTVGGYAAVSFRGFANECREIFIPVDTIVRVVRISPYLCTGDAAHRELTPLAQTMLNSISFFPATQ